MSKRKADSGVNTPEKKAKYLAKFKESFITEFKCVKKSEKGEHFAKCTICSVDINIASGGKNDISRHLKAVSHMNRSKSVSNVQKVNTLFSQQCIDSVSKAEVMFCNFVAEHNLPFLVADHFTDLVKVMFSDSKTAMNFKCKRTKTANIINNALGPAMDRSVTMLCQENKFAIMMDESNDSGGEKSVAILVRVFDSAILRVTTKFLAMPICNVGTAANIFTCLEDVLTERSIPWHNVVAYSSDNANVMVGQNNSVLSRVREKQPEVIDIGCICHIASTCTQYALKKLPVAADDLLVDIYTHFKYSSKRREEYREFLEFTDTEEYKLVKHCGTRWLSLEKCVRRTLQQWPALHSYFNSHEDADKNGSRVQRVAKNLADPVMLMTYHFLAFIFGPLNQFNTMFQSGDSVVAYLHAEMIRLLKLFLAKFVPMSIIKGAPHVTKVDYRTKQHDDELLAVGCETRRYIVENRDDISQQQLDTFFSGVRRFYEEFTSKMVTKFPFEDPTFKALRFLNPSCRDEINPQSVIDLGRRMGVVDDANADVLHSEIEDLQVMDDTELPDFQQEASEDSTATPLDTWWVSVGNLKTPVCKPRFTILVKVALSALCIPHSNADPERCFSMLRKIQTDYRGNLSHTSISAILSTKMNSAATCYNFIPTKDMCLESKKCK